MILKPSGINLNFRVGELLAIFGVAFIFWTLAPMEALAADSCFSNTITPSSGSPGTFTLTSATYDLTVAGGPTVTAKFVGPATVSLSGSCTDATGCFASEFGSAVLSVAGTYTVRLRGSGGGTVDCPTTVTVTATVVPQIPGGGNAGGSAISAPETTSDGDFTTTGVTKGGASVDTLIPDKLRINDDGLIKEGGCRLLQQLIAYKTSQGRRRDARKAGLKAEKEAETAKDEWIAATVPITGAAENFSKLALDISKEKEDAKNKLEDKLRGIRGDIESKNDSIASKEEELKNPKPLSDADLVNRKEASINSAKSSIKEQVDKRVSDIKRNFPAGPVGQLALIANDPSIKNLSAQYNTLQSELDNVRKGFNSGRIPTPSGYMQMPPEIGNLSTDDPKRGAWLKFAKDTAKLDFVYGRNKNLKAEIEKAKDNLSDLELDKAQAEEALAKLNDNKSYYDFLLAQIKDINKTILSILTAMFGKVAEIQGQIDGVVETIDRITKTVIDPRSCSAINFAPPTFSSCKPDNLETSVVSMLEFVNNELTVLNKSLNDKDQGEGKWSEVKSNAEKDKAKTDRKIDKLKEELQKITSDYESNKNLGDAIDKFLEDPQNETLTPEERQDALISTLVRNSTLSEEAATAVVHGVQGIDYNAKIPGVSAGSESSAAKAALKAANNFRGLQLGVLAAENGVANDLIGPIYQAAHGNFSPKQKNLTTEEKKQAAKEESAKKAKKASEQEKKFDQFINKKNELNQQISDLEAKKEEADGLIAKANAALAKLEQEKRDTENNLVKVNGAMAELAANVCALREPPAPHKPANPGAPPEKKPEAIKEGAETPGGGGGGGTVIPPPGTTEGGECPYSAAEVQAQLNVINFNRLKAGQLIAAANKQISDLDKEISALGKIPDRPESPQKYKDKVTENHKGIFDLTDSIKKELDRLTEFKNKYELASPGFSAAKAALETAEKALESADHEFRVADQERVAVFEAIQSVRKARQAAFSKFDNARTLSNRYPDAVSFQIDKREAEAAYKQAVDAIFNVEQYYNQLTAENGQYFTAKNARDEAEKRRDDGKNEFDIAQSSLPEGYKTISEDLAKSQTEYDAQQKELDDVLGRDPDYQKMKQLEKANADYDQQWSQIIESRDNLARNRAIKRTYLANLEKYPQCDLNCPGPCPLPTLENAVKEFKDLSQKKCSPADKSCGAKIGKGAEGEAVVGAPQPQPALGAPSVLLNAGGANGGPTFFFKEAKPSGEACTIPGTVLYLSIGGYLGDDPKNAPARSELDKEIRRKLDSLVEDKKINLLTLSYQGYPEQGELRGSLNRVNGENQSKGLPPFNLNCGKGQCPHQVILVINGKSESTGAAINLPIGTGINPQTGNQYRNRLVASDLSAELKSAGLVKDCVKLTIISATEEARAFATKLQGALNGESGHGEVGINIFDEKTRATPNAISGFLDKTIKIDAPQAPQALGAAGSAVSSQKELVAELKGKIIAGMCKTPLKDGTILLGAYVMPDGTFARENGKPLIGPNSALSSKTTPKGALYVRLVYQCPNGPVKKIEEDPNKKLPKDITPESFNTAGEVSQVVQQLSAK